MDLKNILSHTDHTCLSPAATRADIDALCGEGVAWGVASVCIPPRFVRYAKDTYGDKLKICTVIGFPNGDSTTAVKVFETSQAVLDGADEIDMVISVGALKEGDDAYVAEELRQIRRACQGKILKVIIETCLLSEEEKIRACYLVSESGADFIKTSTGFSKGGATREDVVLLRRYVSPEVSVKAAGGISTLSDARDFLDLGADRLGSSRIVSLVKEYKEER